MVPAWLQLMVPGLNLFLCFLERSEFFRGKKLTEVDYTDPTKIILDADLSKIYGVSTKRLNEQVRRNIKRFPDDFMFKLTAEEKKEVVANCDHLTNLKYSKALPLAFTEHGAVMAASVLNTPRAIEASIFVVRGFVELRQIALKYTELSGHPRDRLLARCCHPEGNRYHRSQSGLCVAL
jgi:ORF6N domain